MTYIILLSFPLNIMPLLSQVWYLENYNSSNIKSFYCMNLTFQKKILGLNQGLLIFFYAWETWSASHIIGCIIAIAIKPTTTAKNTSIIGSSNLFITHIVLSTCSS